MQRYAAVTAMVAACLFATTPTAVAEDSGELSKAYSFFNLPSENCVDVKRVVPQPEGHVRGMHSKHQRSVTVHA